MTVAFYPKLPSNALANKIILITGCSSGLGQAVALDAAKAGATVLMLSRNERKMDVLYDAIVSAGAPTPVIIPFDLLKATPDTCNGIAEFIKTEFGRLDGLLHNAAKIGQRTPLEQYPPHLWLEVMQIMVNTPFLLTQCCLPLLKKSPQASVLFTTANVASQPTAYWGAYGVAKASILAMSKILAEECEENTFIRVNCINPVAAFTSIHVSVFPGQPNVPQASELTHSYLYLLSDYHRFSGQEFTAAIEAPTMEPIDSCTILGYSTV